MKQAPERTRIQYTRKKLIEPYKPYLLQRWNEGCRNAQQLWREIAGMGYTASVTTVSRFIGQLRKDSGTARSFKQVQASAIYAWTGEQKRSLTAQQAARLLVSREERRQAWQQDALGRLSELDTEMEATIRHVHTLVQMARQLQGESLDGWLEEVSERKTSDETAQTQTQADISRLVSSKVAKGHAVQAVAWSPDSRYVASVAHDIQIFDSFSGKPIYTYTKHTGLGQAVQSVAWSPNGRYIASGGMEGTVQVWNARL